MLGTGRMPRPTLACPGFKTRDFVAIRQFAVDLRVARDEPTSVELSRPNFARVDGPVHSASPIYLAKNRCAHGFE